jgi:hypothetical protein
MRARQSPLYDGFEHRLESATLVGETVLLVFELLLVFKVDGESKARALRLSSHDGWLIASRI